MVLGPSVIYACSLCVIAEDEGVVEYSDCEIVSPSWRWLISVVVIISWGELFNEMRYDH